MSGVIDTLGKVFKPVVRVVKKVAPYALAAAAVYFTAGAALGLPGTAGGWGAAAQGITDAVGGEGVLGSVLTGAITQAGYGAAAGIALSAISGGDITKGAQYGAGAGAISGGITGGLGFGTDPFAGIGEGGSETLAGGQGQTTLAGNAAEDQLNGSAAGMGLEVDERLRNSLPGMTAPEAMAPGNPNINPAAPGGNINADMNVANRVGPTPVAPNVGGEGGGFFDKGGWLERNGALSGNLLKGFGTALAGIGTPDQSEIYADNARTRQQIIGENYGPPGRGLLNAQNAGGQGGQAPPPVGMGTGQPLPAAIPPGRYQYDPRAGRVVFVPTGAPVVA